MIVKLPAIFSKITSRADKSYSLTFETRELSGNEASALLALLQQEGYLLYSPNNDIKTADIPDKNADSMTSQKTQSQRLRACLYKVWQTNGQKGVFDVFYQTQMERIIDKVKERIAEE